MDHKATHYTGSKHLTTIIIVVNPTSRDYNGAKNLTPIITVVNPSIRDYNGAKKLTSIITVVTPTIRNYNGAKNVTLHLRRVPMIVLEAKLYTILLTFPPLIMMTGQPFSIYLVPRHIHANAQNVPVRCTMGPKVHQPSAGPTIKMG